MANAVHRFRFIIFPLCIGCHIFRIVANVVQYSLYIGSRFDATRRMQNMDTERNRLYFFISATMNSSGE